MRPYNLKVYYFSETEEYVFSCLNQEGEIQTTIYNKNMTKMSDIEKKVAQSAASFLGAQMEV